MKSETSDTAGDTSWEFVTYPIDASALAFGNFEPIITLWRSKFTPGGGLPAWRDFEFEEFEGWWGKLALATINGETGKIDFVLWGTQITRWWGADYTKKEMMEVSVLGEPAYSNQVAYYDAMFPGGRIGFNFGALESRDRAFISAKWIDLPLSHDHDTPTHLFSAASIIDSDEVALPTLEPLPLR